MRRDLPDSSLTRSERVCSAPGIQPGAPPPGQSRAAAGRGPGRSPLSTGRCAAAPRLRSLLPAPALRAPWRAWAGICPCAWEARGRGGPAARRGSPPAASAPLFHPPRLNSAAPRPGGGSLRLRTGDTDGPGPGRARGFVLGPSRAAVSGPGAHASAAWGPAEPRTGAGGPLPAAPAETGRRGGWRAAAPPTELSVGFPSPFFFFPLLRITP